MVGYYFISHASADKSLADEVVERLEQEKIACWIAPRNISAFEHWSAEINRAVRECEKLVLLLSKSANASEHVLREVALAAEYRKPILAVALDDAPVNDSLHYFITSRQIVPHHSAMEWLIHGGGSMNAAASPGRAKSPPAPARRFAWQSLSALAFTVLVAVGLGAWLFLSAPLPQPMAPPPSSMPGSPSSPAVRSVQTIPPAPPDLEASFRDDWPKAHMGVASSQARLGFAYATGQGAGQNDIEAVRWFRLAAEQGHEQGLFNLGLMYAEGKGGLARNDAEAVRLWKLAAAQGFTSAQQSLGAMHMTGRGGLARDDVEAARLFGLAADQGNALAQTMLAFLMSRGGGGLAKNEQEAARLYGLAAVQGQAVAQANLGNMYAEGRGGLVKNDAEALRLYRLSAAQGNHGGQAGLAIMFEQGRGGVKKNPDEAIRLYQLAAAKGNDVARDALKRLGVPFP
jgi:TPR repeat protein